MRSIIIFPVIYYCFRSVKHLITLLLFISLFSANAQQIPDTSFIFPIHQAAYPAGKGPLILIDDGHYNFHTKEGGFFAFSRLLEQDGYRVSGTGGPITGMNVLKGCKILVIANALDSTNAESWALPTPSAFTKGEIDMIKEWVRKGGKLLLIADHMPFGGAATDLGRAFGFEFINGFAITGARSWPPTVFQREDSTLLDSPVTMGTHAGEKIDSVATFTGSAFRIPKGATGVLYFKGPGRILQPDTAWQFHDRTPSRDLEGFFQGAILEDGKGRVAVFGEAAMFTAQVANGVMKVGFNSESAPQNALFVLNLVHWLDGVSDYTGPVGK
jgi:hypothetical protein